MFCRRSPHGERGLKCRVRESAVDQYHRRSPHGERGLKYRGNDRTPIYRMSLSSWRAWIEIGGSGGGGGARRVALLMESVD